MLTPSPVVATRRAAQSSARHTGFVLMVESGSGGGEDAAELAQIAGRLEALVRLWRPQSQIHAHLTRPTAAPGTSHPAGRIQAMLDNTPIVTETVIDVAQRHVVSPEGIVPLSRRESTLVGYLVERSGVPVSRTEILEEVWGAGHVDSRSRTVDVHVQRLRAKTGMPGLISTIRRFGYRFNELAGVRVVG